MKRTTECSRFRRTPAPALGNIVWVIAEGDGVVVLQAKVD